MKKIALMAALAMVGWSCSAGAQPAQQPDATLDAYKVLLGEANDRLAAQVAKTAAAEARVRSLEAELKKVTEKPGDKEK